MCGSSGQPPVGRQQTTNSARHPQVGNMVPPRTRGRREAVASPAQKYGPHDGRGLQAQETRDRKENRVPVDPGTVMATDDLDEPGDDGHDRQVPSQLHIAQRLVDMDI